MAPGRVICGVRGPCHPPHAVQFILSEQEQMTESLGQEVMGEVILATTLVFWSEATEAQEGPLRGRHGDCVPMCHATFFV